MKNMNFSESIAACDLKVGRCRLLFELLKVCEYSRLSSFLDHGPRTFTNQSKVFLRNHLTILQENHFISPEPKAHR